MTAVSGSHSPSPASAPTGFQLMSDPFSDSRPHPLPPVTQDFEDVHPEVGLDHESHPYTALDCFRLFLSREIVTSVCGWINARAAVFFRDSPRVTRKNFMGRQWRDVKEDEFYVFVSLQRLMGINKLPKLSDYWSISELCQGPPVFTSAVMSRNRYFQILRFLRFSHPDDVVKGNPMSRIDPFFAMVREKFMMHYSAGENFAVDESLILYKGRIHFRQYIKTKRARFGIKLFALCPSASIARGYTWNFCLYTPSLYQVLAEDPELRQLSKSERIPVYLMKSLLNQGRHVVLDNWYSSLNLTQYLLSKNTLTTGTIRPNRGVPQIMTSQRLQASQAVFGRNDDILIVKYNDRKLVHLITSKYEAGYVEHTHHVRGRKREMVKKPTPIQRYNEQMGSVDVVDQLLEPHDPTRKSFAWFKKLGMHMICRMMLNSRTVYQNLHPTQPSIEYCEFLKTVVHEMLSEYSLGYVALCAANQEKRSPTRKRKRTCTEGQASTPVHGLLPIPPSEKKRRPQRRCRVCAAEGRRKDSRKHCPACKDGPALCSLEHFQMWHSQ